VRCSRERTAPGPRQTRTAGEIEGFIREITGAIRENVVVSRGDGVSISRGEA
jgi:hypothetical protein